MAIRDVFAEMEALLTARVVDDYRVFSAEHLAAIALEVGRAKDKVRLTQFLEWKGFDRHAFDGIVDRGGLLAKWHQFKRLYIDEA